MRKDTLYTFSHKLTPIGTVFKTELINAFTIEHCISLPSDDGSLLGYHHGNCFQKQGEHVHFGFRTKQKQS